MVTNIHQFILNPEFNHSDFYVFPAGSVSLTSAHKGQHLRQGDSSFSVILPTLPIGHHTLCLGGKSIDDILVIIFWIRNTTTPEDVADDTEIVSLQNKAVVWCLPGLSGGDWMRHTHRASVSPQKRSCHCPCLSGLSKNKSYRAQLQKC